MLEKVTPDKAVEAMSKYGGTVLKTSLSKDDEKELQDALHGAGQPGHGRTAFIRRQPTRIAGWLRGPLTLLAEHLEQATPGQHRRHRDLA